MFDSVWSARQVEWFNKTNHLSDSLTNCTALHCIFVACAVSEGYTTVMLFYRCEAHILFVYSSRALNLAEIYNIFAVLLQIQKALLISWPLILSVKWSHSSHTCSNYRLNTIKIKVHSTCFSVVKWIASVCFLKLKALHVLQQMLNVFLRTIYFISLRRKGLFWLWF